MRLRKPAVHPASCHVRMPLLDGVRREAGPFAEKAWVEQQQGRLGHSEALWTRGVVPKTLQGKALDSKEGFEEVLIP